MAREYWATSTASVYSCWTVYRSRSNVVPVGAAVPSRVLLLPPTTTPIVTILCYKWFSYFLNFYFFCSFALLETRLVTCIVRRCTYFFLVSVFSLQSTASSTSLARLYTYAILCITAGPKRKTTNRVNINSDWVRFFHPRVTRIRKLNNYIGARRVGLKNKRVWCLKRREGARVRAFAVYAHWGLAGRYVDGRRR